ncbi:hypothetical protein PLICRDRAFT_119990, partial [Plicaturopsis crispa FD-325 SS-3]
MIKVARKYKVRVETIEPSEELQKGLPIWLHIGASKDMKKLNNHKHARCLRQNHKISTTGELKELTVRNNADHKPRRNCRCHFCKHDRNELGCDNPHKCRQFAVKFLNNLTDKWNPSLPKNRQVSNLTDAQLEGNRTALEQKEKLTFDPDMARELGLSDSFRVFTEDHEQNERAIQTAQDDQPVNEEATRVTTHGIVKIDEHGDFVAGGGAYFAQNDARNVSTRIGPTIASAQGGELGAILLVLQKTPKNRPLEL